MRNQTGNLIERSARLQIADLDFDSFSGQPLDPESLRCLRYMHDIDGHSMCYLRDLLVTRAHRNPDITSFLECWVYEERWHRDAIARVLEAHGELAGRASAWGGATGSGRGSSPPARRTYCSCQR